METEFTLELPLFIQRDLFIRYHNRPVSTSVFLLSDFPSRYVEREKMLINSSKGQFYQSFNVQRVKV